ncbi:DUF2452 domain-containing protein [Bacteriovorax stolpii]|uniref:DUF2452 domain-containing protein n=1 Tax=Bacteriovorax stolpii TaxID=960 RepID=A0A2K9NPG8_BACTC|nr:DUF2452 domain-containing protein [Bacteriovorax stolpii]AUN97393.1 DUF2452 domain-containing protein [Bacteriovorax stolpii]QDK42637.1 DUF2452 domain-containing protein [Bacteriovorax stolpii]TDP52567.1 uncharacterized protein DUF2452 [Bacteriovorax stolpii]
MSDDKKPKPVDLDNINLDLMKLKVTDMPSLLEYAHTVGGFAITPTNQGAIKSNARSAMVEQTEEQLNIIYEQMKTLAKQVQDIKKRVYISDLIYNVEIPFTPVIGKTYYLYEENTGKRYLSLVSPDEWGKAMDSQVFLAEIRLNADHTWKVIKSTIELS